MSAREYYSQDMKKEVYLATNDEPVIGGWTASQWCDYAEDQEDGVEQWTAYAIARWLQAYEKDYR